MQKVPLSALSLNNYSNLNHFFDYLEYLSSARNVKTLELKVQTSLAIKVCKFLCNLLKSHHASEEEISSMNRSIDKLNYIVVELSHRLKREKGTIIKPEVVLPSAGQVSE